jgi:hypothetical protein
MTNSLPSPSQRHAPGRLHRCTTVFVFFVVSGSGLSIFNFLVAGVASKLLLDVKWWGRASYFAFWDIYLGSVLFCRKVISLEPRFFRLIHVEAVGTPAEDRPGEVSVPLPFDPELLKCSFQVLVHPSCSGFREGICHLDSAVAVAVRRVTFPLITLLTALFITAYVHRLCMSVLLYCSTQTLCYFFYYC